jgi:hypothetical protein
MCAPSSSAGTGNAGAQQFKFLPRIGRAQFLST